LTAEDYGTFNALVSFILFGATAISPLAMTFTRYFTEYITKKDHAVLAVVFTKIIKKLFIAAFVLFLLFIFVSSAFAEFLKTQAVYIVISGAVIAMMMFSLPFPSLLRSSQKFEMYSFTFVISSISKLILGALLMYFGLGILGGLLGVLIAPLLLILVTLFFLPGVFQKENGPIGSTSRAAVSLVPMFKYFFPAFIAILSFAVLVNIDVILVKHFFNPFDAGCYSIAQIVGKITLFLPAALAIVIFPKCTEAFVNKEHSLTLLYKALCLGGICCGMIIVVSFVSPKVILKILTNNVNPISGSLAGLFSLAMGFYALLWITINFSLAIHNSKFIWPLLVLSILEVFFIYNYHPSLQAVLNILVFFSITSFLTTFLIVRGTSSSYAIAK